MRSSSSSFFSEGRKRNRRRVELLDFIGRSRLWVNKMRRSSGKGRCLAKRDWMDMEAGGGCQVVFGGCRGV